MYSASAAITAIVPKKNRRRVGECARMTRLGLPSELRTLADRGSFGPCWVERAVRCFRPPLGVRRRTIRESERRQFRQRLHVHRALEIDDFTDRLPVVDPAVLIELGLGGAPEVELCLFPLES